MSILRPRRLGLWTTVFFLCALHVWMAASVSRTFSNTFDEIAHLTAGYAYWTEGDFRFQPENGNLPQRVAALPLLWQELTFPNTASEHWRTANVWKIGHEFFHQSGNDLPSMLAAARAMNALLSGVLCLVIFVWARDLFGTCAALLSLVLAAFSPTLLAHGGLNTSDTAAALGFTAATLTWWRLLQRVTLGRLLVAGLCAGFLAVSKFSVVLFAPIALTLLLVRLLRRKPVQVEFGPFQTRIEGWHRIPLYTGTSVIAIGVCITVIWSAYGFRYSAAPIDAADDVSFMLPWDYVLLAGEQPTIALSSDDIIDLSPGPVQAFTRWARSHRLLPEAWLYGLTFVETHARGRLAYFAGEYRLTGWISFFPVVFLFKTPLPTLALFLLGIIGVASLPAHRRPIWIYRLLPLVVILGVYWTFSIQSRLNIGHRHLLPVYPALFVLAGGGMLLVRRHRAWLVVVVGMTAWLGAESIRTRPDYLAYFNPLVGGPSQARQMFVDSSLDWGQDLPRLSSWLKANAGDESVFLSYFGTASPQYYGIEAIRLADSHFDRELRLTVPQLTKGIYCISATMFSRVFSSERGPWTGLKESNYQQLSAWVRYLQMQPSGADPTWLDGSPLAVADANNRHKHFEQLLFARLCHFLAYRKTDAIIGHSILIYRLDSNEMEAVLNAPLPTTP